MQCKTMKENDAIEFNVLSRPKRSVHKRGFTEDDMNNLQQTDESDIDYCPERKPKIVESSSAKPKQTRRKRRKKQSGVSDFCEFQDETSRAVEWLQAKYPSKKAKVYESPHILLNNSTKTLTVFKYRRALDSNGKPIAKPAKHPSKERMPPLSLALFGRVSRSLLDQKRHLVKITCYLCARSHHPIFGPYIINDKLTVWLHDFCAVWNPSLSIKSNRLVGVEAMIESTPNDQCHVCLKSKATLNCIECHKHFHYPCAQEAKCKFDWKMFTVICSNCC